MMRFDQYRYRQLLHRSVTICIRLSIFPRGSLRMRIRYTYGIHFATKSAFQNVVWYYGKLKIIYMKDTFEHVGI